MDTAFAMSIFRFYCTLRQIMRLSLEMPHCVDMDKNSFE